MPLAEFSLEGRKALCVGAGRGIGKGVALVLAEAGAEVAVASLTEANALKVTAQIQDAGGRSRAFAVDATSEPDMQRLAHQVREEFGDLDILANCVGDSIHRPIVSPPGQSGEGMTHADWQHVVDLNLTHAFLGCQAFGPHFLERRGGCVINISSYVLFRGRIGLSAYNAGKAALNQFTRDTALEWARYRVRVNAIGPGSFPDPEQQTPERLQNTRADLAKRVPLGREGYLREVGLLATYLASDAAAYVTGQVYVIDGGLSLL